MRAGSWLAATPLDFGRMGLLVLADGVIAPSFNLAGSVGSADPINISKFVAVMIAIHYANPGTLWKRLA